MTRIALVFAVALSICASAAMAQDYSIGTIQVAKPWSRATSKGAKVAGAYMTITNKGTAPTAWWAAQLPPPADSRSTAW